MVGAFRGQGELRRWSDRALWRVVASFEGPDGQMNPVAAGQLLLSVSGIAVLLSAPLLLPDTQGWTTLVIVSAAMAAAIGLSRMADWSRLPARATLLFPALVGAALTVISSGSPGVFAPLTGVLIFCFAYIGLTQPPGTSLFATPVATVAYLVAVHDWSRPVGVRLIIVILVWVVLAELLARLTRQQVRLTTALRLAAHIDVLTGLPNRRDLALRLTVAAPGDSLVVCDIDHFKALNDAHGHGAGDRVLADFGAMVRLGIREQDYGSRQGGEEFVLLLPQTNISESVGILVRLQGSWASLHREVTFSAGIATCRRDRSPSETLAAADSALYAAKAAGRNAVRAEVGATVRPDR